MNRCQAITKKGISCGAYAVTGSAYCFTHEPSRARERAEAHKRGGRNRPRPTNETPFPETADVKTATGLLLLMEQLLKDTWTLESSLTRSRTLGYLAQVQKGVLEVGELEQRVQAIEKALTARGDKNEKK